MAKTWFDELLEQAKSKEEQRKLLELIGRLEGYQGIDDVITEFKNRSSARDKWQKHRQTVKNIVDGTSKKEIEDKKQRAAKQHHTSTNGRVDENNFAAKSARNAVSEWNRRKSAASTIERLSRARMTKSKKNDFVNNNIDRIAANANVLANRALNNSPSDRMLKLLSGKNKSSNATVAIGGTAKKPQSFAVHLTSPNRDPLQFTPGATASTSSGSLANKKSTGSLRKRSAAEQAIIDRERRRLNAYEEAKKNKKLYKR